MKNKVILIILCAFTLNLNSFASTFYLSPNGNDADNGTSPNTAWKTLTKVNNYTFQPGDILLLEAGGIWDGQLWPKGSGASGNPIIIDLYGSGNKPIINGNGTTYPSTLITGAVMLYNQSYWEINNLEVTNYNENLVNARAGILIISVSATIQNHIYIRNCYVHDVNANPSPNLSNTNNKNSGGIIIFGSSYDMNGNYVNVNSGFNNVLVENCKVYNVTKEGIRNKTDNNGAFPKVNSNIVFRGNHVEKVFGDGIVLGEIFEGGLIEHNYVKNVAYTNTANYAGIWTHYSTGSTIQFNEVCDMTGGYNDGEAFDADNNCIGDIFQYNYSHNNTGGFFLIMPSAQKIIIRYNISQNDGNGKELFHYTSNSYTNNLIYNNTFYIGAGISTTVFKDGNTSRSVQFFNNIIKVDGAINKFADAALSTTSNFANNCFYPASIANINGPATHPGLISIDPLISLPSAGKDNIQQLDGFKLQANSTLINAGLKFNNNGSRDFFNTTLYIDNKADIGAVEYEIPNPTNSNLSPNYLLPTADTYVRDGTHSNSNFGSEPLLSIKKDNQSYQRETFIKFDLSTLTEIPNKGILKLYLADGGVDVATNTWKVYLVNNDNWDEGTLIWDNKPSSNNTEISSISGIAKNNFLTIDLLNTLINEYNGDKMLTLRIVSVTSGSETFASFSSKEYFILDYVPQLIFKEETQSLPIILKNFSAKVSSNTIKLNWETELEINTKTFEIYHSKDGVEFKKITDVKTNGIASKYFFTDFTPNHGFNYYQLYTIDNDGKTQKSDIISTNFNINQNNKLSIFKIEDDIISIQLNTSKPCMAKVQIYNLQGQKIAESNIQLLPEFNIYQIECRANGLMILKVTKDNSAEVKKFIK